MSESPTKKARCEKPEGPKGPFFYIDNLKKEDSAMSMKDLISKLKKFERLYCISTDAEEDPIQIVIERKDGTTFYLGTIRECSVAGSDSDDDDDDEDKITDPKKRKYTLFFRLEQSFKVKNQSKNVQNELTKKCAVRTVCLSDIKTRNHQDAEDMEWEFSEKDILHDEKHGFYIFASPNCNTFRDYDGEEFLPIILCGAAYSRNYVMLPPM